MAQVFLEAGDDYRVVNNGTTVYGVASDDTDSVVIESGATDVTVNANVDRVDFAGSIADFTFVAGFGANMMVYAADGTTLIASIPLQEDADGTQLVFSDGAISSVFADGAITTGGVELTGTAAAITPDAADIDDTTTTEATVPTNAASFFIGDMTVAEDAGTASFTVILSQAPGAGESITVDYATADGTATAASDYTAANGTLTFAEGVTQQTITVDILDDAVLEEDETFTVNLSNVTGTISGVAPAITDGEGAGTITNEDAAEFTLTADTDSVDEGSTVTFTLTANESHAEGDVINYAIAGVEAADLGSGSLTGSVTLGADRSATIAVDLALDVLTEGPETLTLTIDGSSVSASATVNDTSMEPVQGQIITLTNGIDYKDGTENNDVFDGLVNAQGVATLNSSDRLDGKEGDDKLVAELGGGTIATTTISVENIEAIATAASTLDTINMDGLENITIKNGSNTLTLNNLSSTDIGITQLNQAANYNLNYSNTALSGENNLAITLNGAQSDATDGGAVVAIAQQAGSDTSGAETVTLDSIGTNSNFLASLTSQDAAGNSDITSLMVTGTQDLTIATALNASVANVDANTLTGGLTASFGNTASNMSVKGGQGNDAITLSGTNTGNVDADMGTGDDTFGLTGAGSFDTLDVIDGGAGTDTLSLDDADAAGINAALTNVTNFEALSFNSAVANGSTVNATFFGEIETTTVAANTVGTLGLTMGAGSRTVNVGNIAGTSTLGGTLTVTDTGTANDDVLTINNTNITGATDALNNAITSTGYETVNINTGSVVTAVQTTGAVTINADSTSNANTLNISGINAMTLAGAVSNGSGDFTIDASGMTGAATLVMAAAASRSGGVVGNTVITGSDMASTAAGLGDTLLGNTTSTNTINAGGANDAVTGGAVVDTIDLGAGNDTLNASTGNDIVSGGEGNDTLNAGVGEQTLKGEAGDDTIVMGATVTADDVVDGGEGTDTISLSAAVLAANAAGITNFETLSLAGGNVTQDMIQFTNNSGFVTAEVGSNHTFVFNNAGATFNTLNVADFTAGAVGETVTAATVARLVDTSADTLTVNGAGTASALVDSGATIITTLNANNEETITINGGELASEDVTITTLNANDVTSLTLAGAGDVIITNLIGGAANLATVDAGGVTGAVTVNAANSTADMTMTGSLQTGINTLTGGTGADTITGGAGADSLTGGNGNDTINGGAGNDGTLVGGLGNDTIDGGVGNDTITGGAGADALTGGLGADTFVFSATTDGSAAGKGTGADTISDFVTGTDTIDITTGSIAAAISDVTITAAQAADTNALAGEDVYYISTNGAANNLTTGGGATATLTTSDLTASSLANVAAYLGEQFATANTTGGAQSVFVLNWTAGGSDKSYIYTHTEDNTNGILAAELTLLGVVDRGSLATDILAAGDLV